MGDPRYKAAIAILKQARRDAKVSQKELADRLGKTQQYVSKYESHERRLDVIEFIEVAVALKLDAAALVHDIATREHD